MSRERGFTLIELLVASLLLMVIMIGFLRGLLFYINYMVQEQTKNRAIELLKEVSSRATTMPYCDDALANCWNPFLARPTSYYGNWNSSVCDTEVCSFEEQDADGDGLRDFHDPYNGTNNAFMADPRSLANWLNIRPAGSGSSCVRDNQVVPGLQCVYTFKGRNIYVATTLARMVRHDMELGKAVGVIVWYFDPVNRRYVGYSTTVMREKR